MNSINAPIEWQSNISDDIYYTDTIQNDIHCKMAASTSKKEDDRTRLKKALKVAGGALLAGTAAGLVGGATSGFVKDQLRQYYG